MKIPFPDSEFQFPTSLTRDERNTLAVDGQMPDMEDVLIAINELMTLVGSKDLKDPKSLLSLLASHSSRLTLLENGSVVFAHTLSGDTADQKIKNAIRLLPATGGVVDARGLREVQFFLSNPFDGCTKSVVLMLGAGTYYTAVQIIVPNKCRIKGVGRGDPEANATVIKALPDFPTGTAVVYLGGATTVFNCRIQDLTVDASSVTGSIGVLATHIQEMSGVFRCLINNYMATGIKYGDAAYPNAAQNCFIWGCEVIGSVSSSGAEGIAVRQVAAFRGIEDVTINMNGGTQAGVAIRMDNGGHLCRVHMERHTTGILVGDGIAVDGLICDTITGHTSATITDLIKISNATTSQNICLRNINKGASTNLLLDQISGVTITSSSLGSYEMGNGSNTNKTRLHTDSTLPVHIQGELQVNTAATDGDVVAQKLQNVKNVSTGTRVSIQMLADAAESRITAGRGGATTDSFIDFLIRKGSATLVSALKLLSNQITISEKLVGTSTNRSTLAGPLTIAGDATVDAPATDGDVVAGKLSNVSNASTGTRVSLQMLADAAESRITAGRGGSTTDSFLDFFTRKASATLTSALRLDNLAATFREKVVAPHVESAGRVLSAASINVTGTDINASLGHSFYKSLSGNTTLTISNLSDGQNISVAITNPSTHTLAWGTTIIWPFDIAPVQSTSNKKDIYTFIKINGVIHGAFIQEYAA
ncbi:MAG: hypothetical protein ACKVRP_14620 [Bacteroidota bacterium]